MDVDLLPVGWEQSKGALGWDDGVSILEAIWGEVGGEEEEDEGSSSAQLSTAAGWEEEEKGASATGTNPNAAPWQPGSCDGNKEDDHDVMCDTDVLDRPHGGYPPPPTASDAYRWAESESYELAKHLPYPLPYPPPHIATALSHCHTPEDAHYFLTTELGYTPVVTSFCEAYVSIRWPAPSYHHAPHPYYPHGVQRKARRRGKDLSMNTMLGYRYTMEMKQLFERIS